MKGWIHIVALMAGLAATALSLTAADTVADAESGGTGKVLPKPLSQPSPVFPPSLMRSGVDGVVMVSFTVDEEGHVRDPVVENSSSRQLAPYAAKAVLEWRFVPGTRNGRPAAFRLRSPVEFTGRGDEGADLAANAAASHSAPAPTVSLPSTTPPAQAPAKAPATVAAAPAAAPASAPPKAPVVAAASTPAAAPATGVTLPAPKRKATPVYPYEMLINGEPGWADASFVVDYTGRPLFANPAGASNRAFAMAVVAMVEASAYNPGRKGKEAVLTPSKEHYEFAGESSLDPEAKRILGELRNHASILTTNDLDTRPKVVQQVSPAYPRALKDDGLTGQAEIEFIIDREGRVLFPRIVSASHEDFGWAAATAVAQWKFQPPQKGGRNVEAKMSVPILFTAQKLAESD